MAFDWKGFLKPSWKKVGLALLIFALFAPIFDSKYVCLAIGCTVNGYSAAYALIAGVDVIFSAFSMVKTVAFAPICYLVSCVLVHFLAPKPAKLGKKR